jgi:hypothetical protein
MLTSFTVVSLITVGIGFYNTFKRSRDEPSEGDHLRKQE